MTLFSNCSIFNKDKKASASKEEYLRRGKAFLKDSKYKDAWIELRNALQLDPRDAEVHYQLALTYAKLNDMASAFRSIQQAVDLNPDNMQAQLMLGNYYLVAATNDASYFDRAVNVADLILAKEPNNLDACILRGNARAGLKSYDKATEELRQVLEKDPNRIPVYINLATFQSVQKDLDAAEETFKQALRINEKSLEANMALAHFYLLRRNNPDEAEKYLQKAYKLNSKDPRASFSLAMFYMMTRKPDQAEAVLSEAAKKDPGNAEVRRALAMFYLAQGRSDKGKQILQDLVKANPEDVVSRNRLAKVFLDEKNFAEARTQIEYVLDKDSADSEGQALKGKWLLQNGRVDDAIQALTTSRELNPASAFTHYLLGYAHYTKGDTAQAEASFSEALRLDKHMLSAHIGLAKTYLINRQFEPSMSETLKVLQAQPNNIEALLTKGEILLLTDRLIEAREEYLRVIALDPRNPAGQHRLGMIYYRQKQYDSALKKFEEALALNPDLIDVMNDIVAIYTAQKKDHLAIERLSRQVGLAKNKAPFYEMQGKLLYRMQRYNEAEASFRKALELDKNLFSSYALLAQLLIRTRTSPQPAVASLDAALKVSANLPNVYLLKGMVYDHFRDVENAKVNYRKALELAPDLALAANNLAMIYTESDRGSDLNTAQYLAQKARIAVPESDAVADTLGWIYYKQSNYPFAIENLEFSVAKNPNNPVYRYHLGMAYYKMDRKAEAKKALQIALSAANKTKFTGMEEAMQTLRSLP